MAKTNATKAKHHFLPRFYLNGFQDPDNPYHVWQYERGRPFTSGKSGNRGNPKSVPTKKAGMVLNFYTYRKDSGEIEQEEIENALERLEKPHDNIIRKIRQRQAISPEEKMIFANYVDMMMRRVPAGIQWSAQLSRKSLAELKPQIRQEFSQSYKSYWLSQGEKEEIIDQQIADLLAGLEEAMHIYGRDGMSHFVMQNLLNPHLRVIQHIATMRWQFLVAPSGGGFITGDNPVFVPLGVGILTPSAEILFPISAQVALVVSNRTHLTEGFTEASYTQVLEINQRIADNSKLLYAPCRSAQYANMLNKRRHGYHLVYEDEPRIIDTKTRLIWQPQRNRVS